MKKPKKIPKSYEEYRSLSEKDKLWLILWQACEPVKPAPVKRVAVAPGLVVRPFAKGGEDVNCNDRKCTYYNPSMEAHCCKGEPPNVAECMGFRFPKPNRKTPRPKPAAGRELPKWWRDTIDRLRRLTELPDAELLKAFEKAEAEGDDFACFVLLDERDKRGLKIVDAKGGQTR